MKAQRILIFAGAVALLALAGCWDDDDSPAQYQDGNYEAHLINNTDYAVVVEYERETFDLDLPITDLETRTTTIAAHGEQDIVMYFSKWGTARYWVTLGEQRREFSLALEYRINSIDSEDFE